MYTQGLIGVPLCLILVVSLGSHLGLTCGLTSFSGACLGQRLDEKVVWGEIGSGAGFWVRGGGGRKAKVVLSCKRQCKTHDPS
jgi:hypothetical protein